MRITAHIHLPQPRCIALAIAALLLLIGAATVRAASMDPALLPGIKAATFEVVAAKPHDNATYAKKLPLDLIPYQRRTDAYHSIGTAFALGHNRYVTAGHVLLQGINSLWGQPKLRDGKGHVYTIGQILKFSLRRDFVEFSLKHPPGNASLKVNTSPALNQTVYAVGNALGTGIVVRSGLYTSNTPEQQDGQWKWMRFSAAASPGNSGGPLLDAQGKVIGIVLAKSPNENLNYALPIGEVLNAPDDQAVYDKRYSSELAVTNDRINGTFKGHFALPKPMSEFLSIMYKRKAAFNDAQLHALLTHDPGHLFPHGSGSQLVLHATVPATQQLPGMVMRSSNGQWAVVAKHEQQVSLHGSARVQMASAAGGVLFHLRKPRDTTVQTLYTQPRKIMDLLLESGKFTRTVASQEMQIKSLGKPTLTTSHTDTWQRTWQVGVWPLAAANQYVVMLSRAVPNGCVGFLFFGAAAQEHFYRSHIRNLANFMFYNLDGTLAQWNAYLPRFGGTSRLLRSLRLTVADGRHFSYTSPWLRFGFGANVQKIQPDSYLSLGLGFFPHHGHAAWGVTRVHVEQHEGSATTVQLTRYFPPWSEAPDGYVRGWNKVAAHKRPYDGKVQVVNDLTHIASVVPQPGRNSQTHPVTTVEIIKEGGQSQKTMHAALQHVLDDVRTGSH